MKSVLIITYYWPPAGGPGVQRWLKFVKYLPDCGIRPVVYVPENPFYPQQDESLLDEIPKDVEIIRRPIKEPYNMAGLLARKKTRQLSSGIIDSEDHGLLQKFLLYVRGNLFIPDARIGWVKPSVRYLKARLKEKPVDWVITTGPPHSLHLIGDGLKRSLGVNWLADFRDPWTSIHYHDKLKMTSRTLKRHRELEKMILLNADRVVVTSHSTREEFEQISGRSIDLITNGFDGIVQVADAPSGRFVMAHIGSLLSQRNPQSLWQAISELVAEVDGFREDLELQLTGNVSEQVVAAIKGFGLSEQLVLKGYVSHQLARTLQAKASVLLLIESNRPETRAIIPGKLFEYMASGRPIVAIGPSQSDMQRILVETRSGSFFDYQQKEQLKLHIADLYKRFKSGNLTVSGRSLEDYSRRSLTAKLAELLY
jgi:glycosyltransferase involved in cell wall biosynthesis